MSVVKVLKFLNFKRVYYFSELVNKFLYLKAKLSGVKNIRTHFARVNNFGDNFNYDLISYFGFNLHYTKYYHKSEVSLVGSILGAYLRDYKGYVLGSGFIRDSYNRKKNNWKVKMIRGPLSAEQCGHTDVFYADPGILACRVYANDTKNIKEKFALGIIPHSKDLEYIKSIDWPDDVKIINPRQKSLLVAKEINACKSIASSSLHGLIFADSFHIPNIHLKLGDRLQGGLHKFKDYYQGMGVEHEYISFSNGLDKTKILKECKHRYELNYLNEKINSTEELMRNVLNSI